MNRTFLGMDVTIKRLPPLDPDFIPLAALWNSYKGEHPATIAVERPGGINAEAFRLQNASALTDADKYMVTQLVKSMLWIYGGYKILVSGGEALTAFVDSLFKKDAPLAFDGVFMSGVYENPVTVAGVGTGQISSDATANKPVRSKPDMTGCRIGFDAGGSDIKVSAVIDGTAVFSQEIVWLPKVNPDPAYHYKHIVDAMKLAASKMPRVDGIGVSSAGIYVNNRTMAASLFLKVPKEDFDRHVKDIYIRAAAEFGNIPLVVANDGDVTALAGAMEYDAGQVLGIAMGTSQAGGYVDANRRINGWLSELAFTPVDANPGAGFDEWSGDIGRGVQYFSQDAVIKLAPAAGIELEQSLTPAEKLAFVQSLMINGDNRAAQIYETIGVYLAHGLAYYSRFYKLSRVLLMGRVVSGQGGVIIHETAVSVLRDEYPELAESVTLCLPDEKSRRVGQSVAAAALLGI